MGTGTYTILAQTAAEVFGVPRRAGRGELGNSALPRAPVAGGSQLANLMTGAVHKAALAARDELIGLAINDPKSPFREMQANTCHRPGPDLLAARGRPGHGHRRIYGGRIGRDRIEALRDTLPAPERGGPLQELDDHRRDALADRRRLLAAQLVRAFRRGSGRRGFRHGPGRAHGLGPRIRAGSTIRSWPKASGRAASSWASARRCWRRASSIRATGGSLNNNLGDYLIATNADIPDIQVISVGIPDHMPRPSAARRWASSASSASPRRSPMRSSTPPASGCAICRSRWRS